MQPAEVSDAHTLIQEQFTPPAKFKSNSPHPLILIGAQMQRPRRMHHAASPANVPLLPAVSVCQCCRVCSGCVQRLH